MPLKFGEIFEQLSFLENNPGTKAVKNKSTRIVNAFHYLPKLITGYENMCSVGLFLIFFMLNAFFSLRVCISYFNILLHSSVKKVKIKI